MKNKSIIDYMLTNNWLLESTVLQRLSDIIWRHSDNVKLSDEQIASIVEARDGDGGDPFSSYQVVKNSAIVPIHGVIAKYSSMVGGVSQPQGTSCQMISENFDKALADDSVDQILLHIESPGGSAAGVPELAKKIKEANQVKTVIAFADDLACSAAYWLGAQASAFYCNKTGEVGSIGVYTVMVDSSKRAENDGVKYMMISTGKFKGAGFPGTKIKDEHIGKIQERVDSLHEVFVDEVAVGRSMSIEAAGKLADGSVYSGQIALANGLIDGLCIFDDLINRTVSSDNASASISLKTDGCTGDNIMPPKEDKKNAESTAVAVADALATERTRVEKVSGVLAGHPDLLRTALADSTCDEIKATSMLVPVLQSQNKALTEQLAESNKKLNAIAQGGNAAIAQDVEDQDGDSPDVKKASTDDGKPYASYLAAFDKHKTAGKTDSQAYQSAAADDPDGHQAWKDADCPIA